MRLLAPVIPNARANEPSVMNALLEGFSNSCQLEAEAMMGGGQCVTFAVQKWPRPPKHGAIGLWGVGGHVSGKKMAVTGHCQKKL